MPTLRNASVPSALMGRPGGDIERVDITIVEGRIADLAPHVAGEGRDLDGGLVLPAFADIHTHLDKAHIWTRRPNPDGTWESARIAMIEDRRESVSPADIKRRMEFALRAAYAHGTVAIRTHLNADPPDHRSIWEVFGELRDQWVGRIELQAVTLLGPDTLLDAAALDDAARVTKALGGVLGGAVRDFGQSREAMRKVVEKAGELGLDLDLHVDESLNPASHALEDLADTLIETGYDGRAVAGHCCALAAQDQSTQKRTIDKVARAGIAIVSLPMCNLYLQDRSPGSVTPMRRGATLVHEFRAAGVPVALGSDNARDPFYAYGDLDMLEVLREGTRILHLDHPLDSAWSWARSVSADAAAIAGFSHRAGIAVGAPADLLLFRARDWTELLSRPQSDRVVLRNGVAIDTTLPDYRELDDLMAP